MKDEEADHQENLNFQQTLWCWMLPFFRLERNYLAFYLSGGKKEFSPLNGINISKLNLDAADI